MQYTHVWFDLGLTLVHTGRVTSYKKLLDLFNVDKTEAEIERAYHVTDKLFMREYRGVLGKNPDCFMPWYYGVLNTQLKIELELDLIYRMMVKIKDSHNLGWTTFPYSLSVLRELKDAGLKIGLISNWDISCRDVLRQTNLLALLDTVIISSEVGFEKPNEEIFRIALEQSGADPAASIYIGDNYYDDVLGANKVGMTCLLINPYGKLGIEEIDYPHVISSVCDARAFICGEALATERKAEG